jgi:simple sugar transport system ATP-binding protein
MTRPAGIVAPPRLALRGITKRYGDLLANDRVDLTVLSGQVHAVLGENGAGKSTLMKIIYGVTQPDAGSIDWEGAATVIGSPARARRLGIGMVFQHFSLFETLTVAENIALALDERMPVDELTARIHTVSQRYGLPIDPQRLTHELSVGERQRVEIVRCLLQQPRLLIMDEPTSVLAPHAVQALFETLRRLSAEGLSILYISHKLDEIRELCDVVTVLRAGRVVGEAVPRDESNASLARLMMGTDVATCSLTPRATGAVGLELKRLSLGTIEPFGTTLKDIDLTVYGGEIVGIAGVSGNGQKELLSAISGERLCDSADAVRLCGSAAGLLGAAQRRRLGLRFVPEERLGRGAVPAMNLADNCVLTSADLVRHGVVQRSAARAFATSIIAQFGVLCAGDAATADSLSGGNLQKFIVGREIRLAPRVMLVAQPTWGVDVGAAVVIHQALIDLRDAGVAVLIVSEDLDELFSICDRLAVLARGRMSDAEPTARWSTERVGEWMTGAFAGAAHAAVADAGPARGAAVLAGSDGHVAD